jgi:hypothetical protein
LTSSNINTGYIDGNNNKVVRTSDGTLHTVFLYQNTISTKTGIFYAKSYDNGDTWQSINADVVDQQEITKETWDGIYGSVSSSIQEQRTPFCPSILADASDNIYIIWGEKWRQNIEASRTLDQDELDSFIEDFVYNQFSEADKKIIYDWDASYASQGIKAPVPPKIPYSSSSANSGILGSYTRKMFSELKNARRISTAYYSDAAGIPLNENNFSKVFYRSSSGIITYDTTALSSCVSLLAELLQIYYPTFWSNPNTLFRRSWEKSLDFVGWRNNITVSQMRKALGAMAEELGMTYGYFCAKRQLPYRMEIKTPPSVWSCFNQHELSFLNSYFSNLSSVTNPVVTLVPVPLQGLFELATRFSDTKTPQEAKSYFIEYVLSNFIPFRVSPITTWDTYYDQLSKYTKSIENYNKLLESAPIQVQERNARLVAAYQSISNNTIEEVVDTVSYFQIYFIKFQKSEYTGYNTWASSYNKKNITGETPWGDVPSIVAAVDGGDNIHIFYDDYEGIKYHLKTSEAENFNDDCIIIDKGRPLALAVDENGFLHLVHHKSAYTSTIYFTDQILDIPGSEATASVFWSGEGLVYSKISDVFSPTHRIFAAFLCKGSWAYTASICVDTESAAHVLWGKAPFSSTPYGTEILPSSIVNYTKIADNSTI